MKKLAVTADQFQPLLGEIERYRHKDGSAAGQASRLVVSGAEAIFLCHAYEDKDRVRALHRRLRKDGHWPWMDEVDILPGQDWNVEIREAIRRSRKILVCLSQSSISKRGYVQREIKLALDMADEQPEGSIFLIPVRLEKCEIPRRLSALQWVDLFAADGYQRLLSAVNFDVRVKRPS